MRQDNAYACLIKSDKKCVYAYVFLHLYFCFAYTKY